MRRLRDPTDGCPWDVAQSWQDIIPHTLEEVYEVIDAINNQDWPHVEEELGDLLFQIIFYSQLAKEQSQFEFATVIHKLVEKLIRRHPHVFPDGQLKNRSDDALKERAAVNLQWNAIKAEEKRHKGITQKSIIDDVPLALPAVQRAAKIQKKAAITGLDWPDAISVFKVIRGELDELEQACRDNDHSAIHDELGDVFFSLVNLSRKLKVDPEQAITGANRKFTKRFKWIEDHVRVNRLEFADLNEARLDVLWQQSKKN